MERPLYSKIYEYLKEQIVLNRYGEDRQLPTESALIERFSVSRITVKRALDELEQSGYIYRKRGSGSYVKPRNELYGGEGEPSSLLQRVVAFILPSDASSGLSEYIHGAAEALEAKGYYLSIHTTNESTVKERELLETLPKKGIQGIIFYPINARTNMDVVHAHYMNGYPILTIDKYYEGLPVSSVVSDNYGGGYMAAKHLIDQGHARIAFVSTVSLDSASSVKNRYLGYSQAHKDHQLSLDSRLVQLDFIEEMGKHGEHPYYELMLEKLIQLEVSAVQAENDHVAIKILKAANDLGVRVPEQLSIIGFDNHELAGQVEVPITTLEQQFHEIGRRAAELIAEAMDTGHCVGDRIEVPVKWVPRASVATPMESIQIGGSKV
jgi:GntR family transcriptional regulator of arabinose operon